MKLKNLLLMEKAENMINAEELKEKGRAKPEYFTRNRKLSFLEIIFIVLSLLKKTNQVELNELLKKINFKNCTETSYTKQSFSEARQKILPEAFILLNDDFIKNFYKPNDYKRYKKYILLAIDGSVYEVPNNKETRKKYGCATNQNIEIARALTGNLFDVENKLMVSTNFGRSDESERINAKTNIEKFKALLGREEEILFLFDRGYPSMEFIEYLKSQNTHFLMRVSTGFCSEVINSKTRDEVVEIEVTAERARNIKRSGGNAKVGAKIKVRVIKVTLSTGAEEILITDLTEEDLSYDEAVKLYFKRWSIETKFDELKNKFQIENFTGEKPSIIEQDYFATIFLSNLASIFEQEAEEELKKRHATKTLKHEYAINKSVLIGTLKQNLIEILLEDDKDKKHKMFNQLIKAISKNIVPIIKNRSYTRNKIPKSNKYSKSRKRCF